MLIIIWAWSFCTITDLILHFDKIKTSSWFSFLYSKKIENNWRAVLRQNHQIQMIITMVIVYWKICVWAKSKQPADFCYYTLKRSKITEDVFKKKSSNSVISIKIRWKICIWTKSKQSADFCCDTLKRLRITEDLYWGKIIKLRW